MFSTHRTAFIWAALFLCLWLSLCNAAPVPGVNLSTLKFKTPRPKGPSESPDTSETDTATDTDSDSEFEEGPRVNPNLPGAGSSHGVSHQSVKPLPGANLAPLNGGGDSVPYVRFLPNGKQYTTGDRAPLNGNDGSGGRTLPNGNKYPKVHVNPALVPAGELGHNPPGAASNANSNIAAQRKATTSIEKSIENARIYMSNPNHPKGDGTLVDTGSFSK